MKKAQLLWPPLTIGLLLAIVLFVLIGPDEKYSIPDYVVGTRAHQIILQESYAQKEYVYTDLIGKYSSWKALFDLGAMGGISELKYASCGVVRDEIILWNIVNPKKDCYPTKIQLVKNYKPFLQKQMNTYTLRRYSGETIQDNYKFSIIENKSITHVVGIALQPLYFIFNKPIQYEELEEFEKGMSGHKKDADRYLFLSSTPSITKTPIIPDGIKRAGIYTMKLDFHTELPYFFDKFV